MNKLETSDLRWEYEDQLPEMEDDTFKAILNASRVDYVRLYPFVEDSKGNRIWLTHLSDSPTAVNTTYGGPQIDWKKQHDDLMDHILAIEAAASVRHDAHKKNNQCEHPHTCGACHFWAGVGEACRDLRTGDKRNVAKAKAIVDAANVSAKTREDKTL